MNNIEDANPTPRPQDPFTAQDGARLFASINQELKAIASALTMISGTLSNILNKEITTLEQLSRIEEGLSGSRITRLEQEVKEAELELARAEAAKLAAEEKLRLKAEVKDSSIDTQERLRRVASNQWEDLERQKRAAQDAKIQDLKWSVIKAVVTWGSVGLLGIIIAFLWYLVQGYINRGGP